MAGPLDKGPVCGEFVVSSGPKGEPMSEPVIADKKPAVLDLAAGSYWWCRCGRSKKQPFCDGAHKQGTDRQLSPHQHPEPYSVGVHRDPSHVRHGRCDQGVRDIHWCASQTVALRPVRVFLRIPESRMLPALNRSRTLALAIWWLRDRATSISSHVAPLGLSPRMM